MATLHSDRDSPMASPDLHRPHPILNSVAAAVSGSPTRCAGRGPSSPVVCLCALGPPVGLHPRGGLTCTVSRCGQSSRSGWFLGSCWAPDAVPVTHTSRPRTQHVSSGADSTAQGLSRINGLINAVMKLHWLMHLEHCAFKHTISAASWLVVDSSCLRHKALSHTDLSNFPDDLQREHCHLSLQIVKGAGMESCLLQDPNTLGVNWSLSERMSPSIRGE